MGSVIFILVMLNVALTYRGLTNSHFFENNLFQVDKVLVNKEYKRLITAGFLHLGWLHLIFNMITLYIFSPGIALLLGPLKFLLVYFSALIGGHLLSLLIHRRHGDYSSVGASGAVCGVIFAALAIFPGMSVGFFFLPIAIPGWIYGLAFVLYSIYGVRSRTDNVGHEAHLGGALVGMLMGIALEPSSLQTNYIVILTIALPCIVFIVLIATRPQLLFVDNLFYKTHHRNYNIDQRYNVEKVDRQREIDRILDKIHQHGMGSLTKKEKILLDEYSKKIN